VRVGAVELLGLRLLVRPDVLEAVTGLERRGLILSAVRAEGPERHYAREDEDQAEEDQSVAPYLRRGVRGIQAAQGRYLGHG